MRAQRLRKAWQFSVTCAFTVAAVTAFGPTGSHAQLGADKWGVQDKMDTAGKAAGAADAAAGAAQGTGAPAGDSMERLKGAAGTGASVGAGEAMKGGSLTGAAQKGGGAGVDAYMKGGAAGPGAAPAKAGRATDEPPAETEADK